MTNCKMRVIDLNDNALDVQKCLLQDSEFARENYGRYCLLPTSQDCGLIVRVGLNKIKNIRDTVFLNNSVSTFTSLEKINGAICLREITFENFKFLTRPVIAKALKVVVVFKNVINVKKYINQNKILQKIIQDILQLFVFTNQSVIFLHNLATTQKAGVHCLIVISANVTKDQQLFEVNHNTEIRIEKCISLLQFEQTQSKENLLTVGGYSRIYTTLRDIFDFAKRFDNCKVNYVQKLLLIGPQGCGKTTLVRNVSSNCKCVLLEISVNYITSLPNDIEIVFKDIFEQAQIYSESKTCCVILIEDVDMVSLGSTIYLKKFVGQLITLLENIESMPGVVVVGTTKYPDKVDSQLRQPKRFDEELEMEIPTSTERKEIISKILNRCKIKCSNEIIEQLSTWTPGFVGADLQLLVLEALSAIKKKEQDSLLPSLDSNVMYNGFKQALTKVIPSALKGTIGLCITKQIRFSDIGGLKSIKNILDLLVKQQLQNPERFLKLGIPLTRGILLYGPPGCAKTTLVKALAAECNTTFLATSAADLYSPYVGDAEKKIEQLFAQARIGSPSIVFIDEIDAVVGSKSGGRECGVQERILSTLLIEMDGVGMKVNTSKQNVFSLFRSQDNVDDEKNSSSAIEINNGVIVMGATNRPQFIDDALKRPGRFDRLLYIPPPCKIERLRILRKLTEKMPLDDSVDLNNLAEVTKFYSGADLKNLCQESGLYALTSSNMNLECIQQSHFDHVLGEYKPSLNERLINFYESFQKYNT